jgi:hypothetical protein
LYQYKNGLYSFPLSNGPRDPKVDIAWTPTRRFRLVYGDIDDKTRGVLAIGVRDEHAIYRLAVERLQPSEEPGPFEEP